MASGVNVNDECGKQYISLKKDRKYRYILFKLSEDLKEIVVDKCGCRDATYEDFMEDVKDATQRKGECRFAVYDFQFTTCEGHRDKIAMIFCSDDNIKVKSKMVYSASKSAFVNAIDATLKQVQCNDLGDLEYNEVVGKLS